MNELQGDELKERVSALMTEYADKAFGYWQPDEVEVHEKNNTFPVGGRIDPEFPGLSKDMLLVLGGLEPESLNVDNRSFTDDLKAGLQDLTQLALAPDHHTLESYLTIELAALGWDIFRIHRYLSTIYARAIPTTYYASNQRVLICAEVMGLLKQLNKRTDKVRLSGNKYFLTIDLLPPEK